MSSTSPIVASTKRALSPSEQSNQSLVPVTKTARVDSWGGMGPSLMSAASLEHQLDLLPPTPTAIARSAACSTPPPVDIRVGSSVQINGMVYTLEAEIGKGTFGKVYRSKTAEGNYAAIKIVETASHHDGLLDLLARECQNHAEVRSTENVVHYLGSRSDLQDDWTITTFIALELCRNDLRSYLLDCTGLNNTQKITIARQMAQGVQSLHRLGILHRDIKPENFLVRSPEQNPKIKVGDLGMSKKANDGAAFHSPNVGTLRYMAPEVRQGFAYDAKADIWSLGLVMYELFSDVTPTGDWKLPPLAGLPVQVQELLRTMLKMEQELRPSIDEVLAHPLFCEAV